MRKLVLLLSVLLVLSSFASSPVLASRYSLESRIQSLLAVLCQNVFPFSGVVIVPGEIILPNDGSGTGPKLGGDADDLANGRGNDAKPIIRGSNEGPKAPVGVRHI